MLPSLCDAPEAELDQPWANARGKPVDSSRATCLGAVGIALGVSVTGMTLATVQALGCRWRTVSLGTFQPPCPWPVLLGTLHHVRQVHEGMQGDEPVASAHELDDFCRLRATDGHFSQTLQRPGRVRPALHGHDGDRR